MGIAPGTLLGPYEVVALLGAGGMGEVYVARDSRLGRRVAVKVLRGGRSEDSRRFEREARAASRLNHPHICALYDVRFGSEVDYIVMELVEGVTLAEHIKQSRISCGDAVRIAIDIAEALQAAHAEGVVHRDIKPCNVILSRSGAKVLDFGVAKFDCALRDDEILREADTEFRTSQSIIVGTARYMSPEQACGKVTGTPTDIFSFGIVLYELLTNRHPFERPSSLETIHAITSESVIAPSALRLAIPEQVESLLLRMLNKNPDLRPAAADVLRGLREVDERPRLSAARSMHRKEYSTVGRDTEKASLRAALDDTQSDGGLMVVVSGDAGIGKTTLVEEFVREAAAEGVLVATGRCTERLAGSDAYLPWLEALEGLLRSASGSERLLQHLAPTWYDQIGSAAGGAHGPGAIAPPEILKREVSAFLSEFVRIAPTIVTFEDVHWADPSTVDLFAFLSARFDRLPVLFIATCRQADLLLIRHPFLQLKRDLQSRRRCREIVLELLTEDDVRSYVDLQFPNNDFTSDFVRLIHCQTDGHPLFMTDILRYLASRGVIVERESRWSLSDAVPDIARELPESVRAMIQRKLDQLSRDDHDLLLAASVQGHEFDGTILADALSMDVAIIEQRLDALERVHAFVRPIGEREIPDGRLSLRWRFVHALYQNALYAQLGPGRRASLSRRIADALSHAWAGNEAAVATQLAFLFETSRDFARAADCFLIGALNASRLFANQEAVDTATRGLRMLEGLPPNGDRDRSELSLRLALGVPLMMLRGYSAREPTDNFIRAQELCTAVGAREELFHVRWGLYSVYCIGGNLPLARQTAGELMAMARQGDDPTQIVIAYFALVVAHAHMGHLRVALGFADEAFGVSREPAPPPYLGFYEPITAVDAEAARIVWALGYPTSALQRANANAERARTLGHPETLAFSWIFCAFVHQFRGEPALALERAEQVTTLCDEHGLAQTRAWGLPVHGWALAMTGRLDEGIAELRQSIADHHTMHSRLAVPYFHALLAEALHVRGDVDAALEVIDQGLAMVADTSQAFHAPDLHRLRAQTLIARGVAHHDSARHHLRLAIELAQAQNARSHELRAAVTLARFLVDAGRQSDARSVLAPVYEWFTEGHDTADLQTALQLLSTLTT